MAEYKHNIATFKMYDVWKCSTYHNVYHVDNLFQLIARCPRGGKC